MTALLVDLAFRHDSGLPEDEDHITWVLRDELVNSVPTQEAWDLYASDIAGLMNDPIGVASASMIQYLSVTLNAPAVLSAYNITGHLDGSDHGSPVRVANVPLDPIGVGFDPLPAECAAVITWYAEGRNTAQVEDGGTRPKQRRTGHSYFGPLGVNTIDTVDGEARFKQQFIDDLEGFAEQLLVISADPASALSDNTGILMAVWSRVDQLVRPIVGGHIDNAVDIQRRRGVAATAREHFGAAG